MEKRYVMPQEQEIVEYTPKALQSVTAKKPEVVEALEALLADEPVRQNDIGMEGPSIGDEAAPKTSLVDRAKALRKRIREMEAFYERDSTTDSN